jgi:cation diffusion facilitator family transporter
MNIVSDQRNIRNVTYAGAAANAGLAILKCLVGLLTGSMALFADGIHSMSDLATDAVVLLGVHIGAKEPDHEHPYGHGRIETFAAAIVAFVLIGAGALMIQRASAAIVRLREAGTAFQALPTSVLLVALLSVLAKEVLYRVTRRIAVATSSSALYANAWHHRSDALSSVAVVVGFVASRFGYVYGDEVATVAVGIMIVLVAFKIIDGCLNEFAERSVDKGTVEQIKQILSTHDRVRQWHKLRTRSVGREIFMDVHILVNPDISITAAHKIAESLEEALHAGLSRPANIMVHIEPDEPDQRK